MEDLKSIKDLFWNGIVNIFKSRKKIYDTIHLMNPDYVVLNSVVLSWIPFLLRKHKTKKLMYVRETFPGKLKMFYLSFFTRYLNMVIHISEIDKKDL